MHDLMHDLAVSVAGSLITTFDCEKEAIDVKARHFWIDDRKPPRVVPNFKENRMRTIIFQLPSPRVSISEERDTLEIENLMERDPFNNSSEQPLIPSFPRHHLGRSKMPYVELQHFHISKKIYTCGMPAGSSATDDDDTRLRNLIELSVENKVMSYGNDKMGQMAMLTSLRSLKLDSLPKLEFLVPGLQHLTTLRQQLSETLKIDYCAILSPRCKRETGEDWPKIAHIPRFELDENS
ncbi:putative disease resistance protein RGA3 [Morella rubra]|uniref:Putative disease resistance protein RGA3 n=1 Tax=Morella rubra TaxID=262757 RepID=A0A6A1WP17_9ROSI|nr:putative disease resistance protein RGA3 [Morella rubra]